LGHLWIVELTHIYIFAFKFTLRYLQPDINPIVCHQCQRHQWQFATGINNTSKTGGKFATGAIDTGGQPSVANISVKFSKKFETALMVYSGAWGKLIHEKNPEAKNLVTLSL
jgi:hypothetical protein